MRFAVEEIIARGCLQRAEKLDPAPLLGGGTEYGAFKHPITAEISAQATNGDILASGRVQTLVTYQCARCLEDFTRTFEGSFAQTYSAERAEIDFSDDIRAAILVELPIKALCREDCKGICGVCGANRNRTLCVCKEESSGPMGAALKNFPFQ